MALWIKVYGKGIAIIRVDRTVVVAAVFIKAISIITLIGAVQYSVATIPRGSTRPAILATARTILAYTTVTRTISAERTRAAVVCTT